MIGALIFCCVLAGICALAYWHGGKRAVAGFLFVLWGLLLLCCLIAPPVVWPFLFAYAVLAAALAAIALKSRRATLVSLLATVCAVIGLGALSFRRYREMASLLDSDVGQAVPDGAGFRFDVTVQRPNKGMPVGRRNVSRGGIAGIDAINQESNNNRCRKTLSQA
jgi:hypothetical protein